MASKSDMPKPDTIMLQSPPEVPSVPTPAEPPVPRVPEIIPDLPDTEWPDSGPDEWQTPD